MSVRLYRDEEEASVGTGFDLETTYRRLRYQVLGWNQPEDAILELANSAACPPTTVFMGKTLYRQPITVRLLGYQLWESDVLYTLRNPSDFQKTIRGRTTGGTQKILGSLFTAGHSPNAPDFKGLIGYNPKDQSVEGAEIIVPILEWSMEVSYPIGYVTNNYLIGLANLTGSVNNSAWLGLAAGQALYQGAEFTYGNTEPTVVTHNVAISPNIFGVTIAGLQNVNKEGWDYLWFLTEDSLDGQLPIKKAKHWYSERVYRRANFSATLGF